MKILLTEKENNYGVKNRVYIVKYEDAWDDVNDIEGIYSTREKAEKAVKEAIGNWVEYKREEVKDNYRIEEWVVDLDI